MTPERALLVARHRNRKKPILLSSSEWADYRRGRQRAHDLLRELLQVAGEVGIRLRMTVTYPYAEPAEGES